MGRGVSGGRKYGVTVDDKRAGNIRATVLPSCAVGSVCQRDPPGREARVDPWTGSAINPLRYGKLVAPGSAGGRFGFGVPGGFHSRLAETGSILLGQEAVADARRVSRASGIRTNPLPESVCDVSSRREWPAKVSPAIRTRRATPVRRAARLRRSFLCPRRSEECKRVCRLSSLRGRCRIECDSSRR